MTFTADLWPWEARSAAWQFVTLPRELAADIAEQPRPPRGFGSVRVSVTIGGSTWQTSIFPDSDSGSYVLPIKKGVRAKEGLEEGDTVEVELVLID